MAGSAPGPSGSPAGGLGIKAAAGPRCGRCTTAEFSRCHPIPEGLTYHLKPPVNQFSPPNTGVKPPVAAPLRGAPSPDTGTLALANKWVTDQQSPPWARRYRTGTPWTRILAGPARHGWTPRDVNTLIRDWVGTGHWLPDDPHKPIGLLGAMLAAHGDLDNRPSAYEVAREHEELARARARIAAQLAARDDHRRAREAGRAALSGPGRQAAREALRDIAERARRRHDNRDAGRCAMSDPRRCLPTRPGALVSTAATTWPGVWYAGAAMVCPGGVGVPRLPGHVGRRVDRRNGDAALPTWTRSRTGHAAARTTAPPISGRPRRGRAHRQCWPAAAVIARCSPRAAATRFDRCRSAGTPVKRLAAELLRCGHLGVKPTDCPAELVSRAIRGGRFTGVDLGGSCSTATDGSPISATTPKRLKT